MPRTVRDARIETRTARERLKARRDPYWRAISPGAHLGYYKGKRGGSWIGRYRSEEDRYIKKRLGLADDTRDPDGRKVLSFEQAQDKARDWFEALARKEAGVEPEQPYTVADAMRDYLGWFASERKGLAMVRSAIDAHILPTLGNEVVRGLTAKQIRGWRDALACSPARLRSRKGAPLRTREAPQTREEKRQRKATANRIFTILKAGLNYAYAEGEVSDDSAWRRVRPFKAVEAARVRYLSQAECKRLVNASGEPFRDLVKAALFSGCRYGEIVALEVADFNPDSRTVLVRSGKGGRARHVHLSEEGSAFFQRATAGRAGDDTMFLRADGKPWGASHQGRPLATACEAAKIKPAASFHILRHTHASHLAMQGVPMPVVAAQLGHADTRMTEKHYAHLSPGYIADTLRAGLPALGIHQPDNVVDIADAG
jgi:integrase